MGVSARYTVRLDRDDFRPAGELSGTDLDRLRGQDYPYGRLILTAPGQSEAVLEDDLHALITGPCLLAVSELAAGNAWGTYVTRYPGEYRLERVGPGPLVRLSGDVVPTFEAPADELLPALYRCGVSGRDLLHRVLHGRPDQTEALAALDQLVDAAAVALA